MKKAAITVATYFGAIFAGCVLAAVTPLAFVRSGDFGIVFQMFVFGIMSGFYILTFTPLVIVTHLLMRKARSHLALPMAAITVFGAVFPVLGLALFPGRWWPEEPIDMKWPHLVAFVSLALVSIGTGVAVARVRNRRLAAASR